MKCPRCGFVSFDDLTHCKKCGAQLKEANEPVQEVKRSQAELSAVSTDSYDAALPPHWHNTIQTIKKELEAIEGGAVDKASSANRSPTLVAEKNLYYDGRIWRKRSISLQHSEKRRFLYTPARLPD